ncbi:hypothetical protein INS49_004801 [Diaporthe citri]|uniref:uncharacterized protein n=1 Tax=Diaporthe citri TaxID=83186 RepID=UPI001C80D738|nr:uncharacterized protein INS49_004801 [Diaporthe citri]KAG6354197.1 hypothetical protein INS49_004801 [Diaporthe citri]
MAKSIQSFEQWGYVVDPNARGFKQVVFSGHEKHCNIYHQAAVDPMVPVNTFTVTQDRTLLKIPRAFNNHPDIDARPKAAKLSLRDQIVSYWSLVEHRDLKHLKQIKYTGVIEENLQGYIEQVYDMMGVADEYEQLTLRPTDQAFQLLLTRTPFMAGVQKMLNEYADKFGGKRIASCHFDPVGGFDIFDFTINLT